MCGVFGIYHRRRKSVVTIIMEVLARMQNRGQDSVGLATTNSYSQAPIRHWKEIGSAFKWFSRQSERAIALVKKLVKELRGNVGIGHVRYSTASLADARNAQPHYADHFGKKFVLVSNGDIPFAERLRRWLKRRGYSFASRCDAEVIVKLIAQHWDSNRCSEKEAFMHVGRTLAAAYSLIAITPNKWLFAMRDPWGIRPLWWTENKDGVYICSESALIEGYGEVHEVPPGVLMMISPKNGTIEFHRFAEEQRRPCLMEYFYFSRPDSLCDELLGILIDEVRYEFGQELGRELLPMLRSRGIKVDLVTAVPYSGNSAGEGCAAALRVRWRSTIIKDRFSERIFQLDEVQRSNMVRRRFKINKRAVKDKIIVVVDDSIVRGDQGKAIVKALLTAGAKMVIYTSTAPPFKYGCYLGINTPALDKLIAHNRTTSQVRRILGAHVLYHLSMEGICKVLKRSEDLLCTGCFTGKHPVPVPLKGRKEVGKAA